MAFIHLLVNNHLWRIRICGTQWFGLIGWIKQKENWAPVAFQMRFSKWDIYCLQKLCMLSVVERYELPMLSLQPLMGKTGIPSGYWCTPVYTSFLHLWSLTTNGMLRQESLSKPRVTMFIQNPFWQLQNGKCYLINSDARKRYLTLDKVTSLTLFSSSQTVEWPFFWSKERMQPAYIC